MPEATRPVILGQFGPPTLACIRSWGRAGMSTGMICVQEKQHTVPGSRYLSQYCLLPKDRLYTVEGLRVIAGFLDRTFPFFRLQRCSLSIKSAH